MSFKAYLVFFSFSIKNSIKDDDIVSDSCKYYNN